MSTTFKGMVTFQRNMLPWAVFAEPLRASTKITGTHFQALTQQEEFSLQGEKKSVTVQCEAQLNIPNPHTHFPVLLPNL